MKDEELECRDCGELFNPRLAFHAERGYRDQCGDCAISSGDDEKRVKAFTGFDPKSGDWQGIEIVSHERWKEYKKVEAAYAGETFEEITVKEGE